MQLHQIHSAHGQAGAIDHAANVAFQSYVVEAVFSRLGFTLVFLTRIVHLGNRWLAIQRVTVDVDFCV